MKFNNIVAIACGPKDCIYPEEPPYRPDELYPEFGQRVPIGKERNCTCRLFRELMLMLGLDKNRFCSRVWNPFGTIIRPGSKVLLKPNLVRHIHIGGGDWQSVVTHGSLIRCILDYVGLALKGQGEITVGDAPLQSADFDRIIDGMGLLEICEDVAQAWKVPVRILDFRLVSVVLDDDHRVLKNAIHEGDPNGYRAVDLAECSLLEPLNHLNERFRVTNYDCGQMTKHHNTFKHEYLIPQTVLDADVILNVPKLKTHRKVGLTCSLKNLVGINGHKDWLPHHRFGAKNQGGDEYLHSSCLKALERHLGQGLDTCPPSHMNDLKRHSIRLIRRLGRHFNQDPYEEGSWFGNDTLWRTVLDLNRLLLYADRQGVMTESIQRKSLSIVDAIVAGEGEGPMEPDARSCDFLAGGFSPASVDAVLATMIGFDYRKIPLIKEAFELEHWPIVDCRPDEIMIESNLKRWESLKVGEPCSDFLFAPPMGWIGHIESDYRQDRRE